MGNTKRPTRPLIFLRYFHEHDGDDEIREFLVSF